MHFSKFILLFIITLLISTDFSAQEFPRLDLSPMDISIARNENMSPLIRVIYSRPQKRNRVIFGDLVPFGKVWRTGANEATELEIYEPLKFGDKIITPGTYTLYTIPNEKDWIVIINCDTNAWGSYNYDESLDHARITVNSKSAAAPIESLSMAFKPIPNGFSLMIGWDDRFIEVPFVKTK